MAFESDTIRILHVQEIDGLLPGFDAGLDPGVELPLDDSPTYRWNGATLRTRIGDVLPIVYGRHLVAPTLINAFIEEGEHETLNMLMAFSEGEIEAITNVKVNGNPIENLYGNNPADPYGESAEVSVRLGKINQTPIDGFDELFTNTPVDLELRKDVPFEFTGTINTARALRIELEIDRLFQKEIETENFRSNFFSVRVELRLKGAGSFDTLGYVEVNKKTTATFKRFFKTEYLVEGQYELRITKVSEDEDGVTTFGKVKLLSIAEITSERLEYPGVSLIGLRLLAFQDLQGSIPNITAILTGKKIRIPKVTFTEGGDDLVDWEQYYFDPAEGPSGRYKRLGTDAVLHWDETSFVTEFSGNPVWCLRDLLLNKIHGLGDFIDAADINEAAFLTAAKFADEGVVNDEGELEKRFQFDGVFDTAARAPDVLAVLLRSFRGILFQSEGTVRVTIEKAETPVAMFNMGNILAESFSLRYLTKKLPNVIAVDYTNRDKVYLRDRLEIADSEQELADVPSDVQRLQMIGVTRTTQVLREARIFLNKLKSNRRVISFQAFFDAVLMQPFDVIEFQHDVPAFGDGGRVERFCTTTDVNLDKDVVISPGKTFELKVRNPLTDDIETRTVTNLPGVVSTITVSVAFSFTPQKNDIWSLVELGAAQLYRVTKISKPENGRVTITALEHNNDVYDPSAIIVPQDIYTHLILDVPKVQNLVLDEQFNKNQNGITESRIQVSWTIPPVTAKFVKQASEYEVWMSDNDGASWDLTGKTEREFYTIPQPVSRTIQYRVAVVSVAENGEKNPVAQSPQQTIRIQGLIQKPVAVANFRSTFTDEIELTWDRNPETNVLQYEIRSRDDGWGSESDSLIWRGDATKFIIVRPTARAGVNFFIRALNNEGESSEFSTSIEPVNVKPTAPQLIATTLFQQAFLTWFPVADEDIQYYEVWQNSEPIFFAVEGQEDEQIIAREAQTAFVADLAFDPTFFRVVAVDRFGRGNFSNIISVPRTQIGQLDLKQNSILEVHITDESISAPKLQAGSVTAGKVAAQAIVAENIDVFELSAISASLGKIVSGEITGAIIKTSDDVFRIELDSIGLRAFDIQGRQTLDLSSGTLKLLDPECCECFSFLDAGQLQFKTPFGTVPYATRICSGVAVAGDVVKLELWKGRPELILGIKRLTSYDSRFPESCQEWCVYSDNVRSYDFGGANFGWCFDVHACLAISGGTRAVEIFNVPFDTVRCTGAGTCEALVTLCLQLFTHDEAPDVVCFGCLCYEVLFRKVGAGAFCCCQFDYLQPHNTQEEIKTTNIRCHTIQFGEIDTWEVQVRQTALSFVASPFAVGGFIFFIEQVPFSVDCSFLTTCVLTRQFGISGFITPPGFFQAAAEDKLNTAEFNQPGGAQATILSSAVSYFVSGILTARKVFVGTASAAIFGQFGGGASHTAGDRVPFQKSFSFSGARTQAGFIGAVNFPHSLYVSAGSVLSYQCAAISASVCVTNRVCLCICCICQFFCAVPRCEFVGPAESCTQQIFRSMRDITGEVNILDPFGEINFLAVAYR